MASDRKTILIVDRSPARRRMIATVLGRARGVQIIVKGSVEDAVRWLTRHSASLVISEAFLPPVTGLDLLRWMGARSRYRTMPVLILTAWEDEAVRAEALATGASLYLTTPIRPDDLFDSVCELLEATVPACSTATIYPGGQGGFTEEESLVGKERDRMRGEGEFFTARTRASTTVADQPDTVSTVVSLRENLRLQLPQEPNGKKPHLFLPMDSDALGVDCWMRRREIIESWSSRSDPDRVADWISRLCAERYNLTVASALVDLLTMTVEDVLTPMLVLLKDPDPRLRFYATVILGERYDERAIPALMEATADPDPNVQFQAIEALGRLRAQEASEILATWAQAGSFYLASAAIEALRQIGTPRAARALVPLLADQWLSLAVIEALGEIATVEDASQVVQQLNPTAAPVGTIVRALATIAGRFPQMSVERTQLTRTISSFLTEQGKQNLLRAVADGSEEDADALAFVLSTVDEEWADRALVRLLHTDRGRDRALEALVHRGYRVTALLLDEFWRCNTNTKQAIAVALGQMGDPRAIPVLARAVMEVPEIARTTAQALARLCDQRGLDALVHLLGQNDEGIRQAVISALGSLHHPAMTDSFEHLLAHPEAAVREAAVRIVREGDRPDVVEALRERCQDEDERVRAAALERLAAIEGRRAVSTLARVLSTDTPRVREAAVRALAQVDGQEAVAATMMALTDGDPWVRKAAVEALAQQSAWEALDDLLRMAETDVVLDVRLAAIEALGRTGGPQAQAVLSRLGKGGESHISQAALSALARLAHPSAIWSLLTALITNDIHVRQSVVRLLGERGGVLATEALRWVALHDPHRAVVQAAVDALAHLATPSAIATLIELTGDDRRRSLCVAALARLGSRMAPEIARGIQHPSPQVRCAVVEALTRFDGEVVTDALMTALTDEDPSVRRAALKALAQKNPQLARTQAITLIRTDADPAIRRTAHEVLNQEG